MAVISFSEKSPEAAWAVAGWAFRQILADVLVLHPHDNGLAALFEEAAAVGYLRLGCLDEALAVKVASAIKKVAAGVLEGTVRSGIVDRFGDESMTQEYLKGLRMLLEAAEVAGSRSAQGLSGSE